MIEGVGYADFSSDFFSLLILEMNCQHPFKTIFYKHYLIILNVANFFFFFLRKRLSTNLSKAMQNLLIRFFS